MKPQNLTSLPKALLLLLSIFLRLSTLAQTSALTYQGRLNDSGGPANGSYDLQFAIYDALSGGNQVGATLTQTGTAVSNGLFTVSLDFGAAVFTGADRWLEIAVSTNGGGAFATLSPRQQVTSAPYAINAASAASATVAATANSVAAANIAGTIPLAQLPTALVTNGTANLVLSGSFAGNGAGLSGMALSSLNSQGAVLWTSPNVSFTSNSSPGVGQSLELTTDLTEFTDKTKHRGCPPPYVVVFQIREISLAQSRASVRLANAERAPVPGARPRVRIAPGPVMKRRRVV